jgi:hypothetical protein
MMKKKKHLPTSFSGYLPDIRRFKKNPSAPLGFLHGELQNHQKIIHKKTLDREEEAATT